MARRLSEEVLKVAGLSEDEGEGKQAAEKVAAEVGFLDFLAHYICRHFSWFCHWHKEGEECVGSILESL